MNNDRNNAVAQRLTQEQALILTGFTGIMCVADFGAFHADVECRLGRPVFVHEFPKLFETEIKDAYREDFLALIPEVQS